MALLASVFFGAEVKALTVNFSDDRGPVTRPGQGYLYSWWHTRESPMHGNLELKPTSWRIGYWGTWDYEYQPMVDQGVSHIQVLLTDAFRNRAHTTVGGFSHDYTWQSKGYLEVVEDTVRLVNERGWTNVAFDLINEPDAFGIDGIGDWYSEAWVPAFRKVRELRPQAEIVGPGFFSANLSHLRSFLTKAKRDNVVPDIVSQHLLDNQSRDVVESYTTQIREMLDEFGLARRPISFNEYINPGHVAFVEDVVDALAQAERVGVHSMMHSSWDDSGELPPWNSTGDAACFDGIMSIPAQRERACYWAYKFYGDMAGRMVGISRSGAWDGLASLDAAIPVARVLMGGSGTSGNVTLTLNNVPPTFGSSVNVHIERVTTNSNDLTAAPTLHAQQDVSVNGGTATISITNIPARTATMVTIRPAGLPVQAAKPTFSPLRGTYWIPMDVTLTSATTGASIRYTTDGTLPGPSSMLYTGPIHVPVTTTIRAVAVKAGMRDSEVADGTFTIRKYDNGLYGEYFTNTTLTGQPVLTRGDRELNIDYGGARWDASLPYSNFSARWTGRLRPTFTGAYQLHTESDDGIRLWLDDVLLIDNWTVHPATIDTANITLTGGQDYDLRIEYFDAGSDKVARLLWTPPGGTQAVVPSARLFPPTSPSGANLLVGAGTSWKYLAPTSAAGAPAATWKDSGFDDNAWLSGPARFGWGNDGEVTLISGAPTTTYFRKVFNVPDPGALAAMLDLAVVRDDGVAVYLNGSEILRDNLPEGTITYDIRALGSVGNSNERTPARGQVPRSMLVAGINTIAIEVHQRNTSDSDGGFDCWLSNPTSNTPPVIGPIPDCTVIAGAPVPPVGFSVSDGELFASLLTTSASSSNPALIPNESMIFGGYGRSRTLSLTPIAGRTGTVVITVGTSDGFVAASTNFTVTVVDPPVNTPPTISNVTDRNIFANEMSDEILFDVGDAQTEPGLLTVSVSSSNPTLIPNANLFINGTGDWRTLSIVPVFGQDGTAVITLTVSDGQLQAVDTFTVTVLPAPVLLRCDFDDGTLQGWTDVTVPNSNSGPRNWAISPPAWPSDTEDGAGAVGQNIVGGNQDSAHPTLRLCSPKFVLTGEGDLTVYLSGGRGSGTLSGSVTSLPANSSSSGFQGVALRDVGTGIYVLSGARSGDGTDWQRITFSEAQLGDLEQNAIYALDLIDARHGGWGWTAMDTVIIPGTFDTDNAAPTISDVADAAILRDTSAGPIAFTIGDAETDPGSLVLSGSSSNSSLVPLANIVFGGSGENRTLTITPTAGQTGTTVITLAVFDGTRTARSSFVLSVGDSPVIIAKGFTWDYLAPLNAAGAPPADWATTRYVPSGWSSGRARIGYGDDGEVTPIPTGDGKPFTVYLRKMFTVTDLTDITGLRLALSRDDGAVVYLNGVDKWRSNMPKTDAILYDTPADSTVSGTDETTYFTRDVSSTELVVGNNLIAVEVHQRDAGSSDLGFDLEVTPLFGNTPPGITAIADRSILMGASTGPIAFAINDAQTDAALLILDGSSSNTSLVPNANIVFGGGGEDRTVTVTPAAGQAGTAVITIVVSDGELAAEESFLVSVPILSRGSTWYYLAPLNAASAPPANWTTVDFTPTGWSSGTARIGYGDDGEVTPIPISGGKPFTVYFRKTFIVTDPSAITGLHLALSRDDGAVVYLNGADKWRSNMPDTGAIDYDTPADSTVSGTNETTYFTRDISSGELVVGTNVIAVEVHQRDSGSSDLGFDLEVTPLSSNTPPTITAISDRSILEGSSTGPIGFTIGDLQTPAASLSVIVTSSNTVVLPNTNLVLGGSGANRTLTATPVAAGTTTVTVTVSDGSLQAEDTFALTVIHVNPGIIAEDHFFTGGNPAAGEYNIGALTGQNPLLAGWNTAWTKAAYSGSDVQSNPIGLTYPGLETTGGRSFTPDATRSGHILAAPFTNATTGTYYLSILLRLDSDDPTKYRTFELHYGGFDDNTHRTLQLGQYGGDLGTDGYGLCVLNNNALCVDLGPADTAVNLFVLKFDFSATADADSVTVWRNPGNLGGAEPTGGSNLSGFDMAFDRTSFAHWASYAGAPGLNFDEIRIGTTWAAVTPPGSSTDSRLIYEFEDGTLQGWMELTIPNDNFGPQHWVAGAGGDAQAGSWCIKQHLHPDSTSNPLAADYAHPTLWLRSPEFRLSGTGDLTVWLFGGGDNPLATPSANEAEVPAYSVDTADGGWHGVVLRNAATGDFVLARSKPTDGTTWEQVMFSARALAALDQNAVYTLDLIDARNNTWGWANMDTVAIPGVLENPVIAPGKLRLEIVADSNAIESGSMEICHHDMRQPHPSSEGEDVWDIPWTDYSPDPNLAWLRPSSSPYGIALSTDVRPGDSLTPVDIQFSVIHGSAGLREISCSTHLELSFAGGYDFGGVPITLWQRDPGDANSISFVADISEATARQGGTAVVPLPQLDGRYESGVPYTWFQVRFDVFPADFDLGETVDLIDFAYIGADWMRTDVNSVADITGQEGIPDRNVDYRDLSLFIWDYLKAPVRARALWGNDFNSDGTVNLLDFCYMGADWMHTDIESVADITGPDGTPDSMVDYYDLFLFTRDYLKDLNNPTTW